MAEVGCSLQDLHFRCIFRQRVVTMKQLTAIVLIVFLSGSTFGQQIFSGDYSFGLKLSYDSATKKITGYFEDYTGEDEKTGNSRFSCIFYIEGVVTGKKFAIKTYFPTEKSDDLISGTMEIVTNRQVKIKLRHEHGGCWNVQHFADEPVDFTLGTKQPWLQVRYVNASKGNFYSDSSDDKRMKSYIVKGDFVCVGKIGHGWAYCTYYGKKSTTGWMKISELNEP